VSRTCVRRGGWCVKYVAAGRAGRGRGPRPTAPSPGRLCESYHRALLVAGELRGAGGGEGAATALLPHMPHMPRVHFAPAQRRFLCCKCSPPELPANHEDWTWQEAGTPRYSSQRTDGSGKWDHWCAPCETSDQIMMEASAQFLAQQEEAEEQDEAAQLGPMALAGQGLDSAVAAGGLLVSRFFQNGQTAVASATEAARRMTVAPVDQDAVAKAVAAAELAAQQSAHRAASKTSARGALSADQLVNSLDGQLDNNEERQLLLKVLRAELRPGLPAVLRLRQGDGGRDNNLAIYTRTDAEHFVTVRLQLF